MTDDRRFPMHQWSTRNYAGYPKSFPWALIEPHRKQVQDNHNQTLERLAERGGLAPTELLAAMQGKSLWEARVFTSTEPRRIADAEEIRRRIEEFEATA